MQMCFITCMEDTRPNIYTLKTLGVGLVLTGLFFVAFFFLLQPFVPSQEAWVVWLVSAYTASSLTGVFFIAYHMFVAVLIDARRRKQPSF